MATINKTKQNRQLRPPPKNAGEDLRENEHLCPALWMEISAVTMEISIEVPHKTKCRTTCDPAVPLLGVHSKE
jgi:hypothetical protein